jgi:hypothetical protein
MTTLIIPDHCHGSEEGIYMRLEGYTLTLVNEEDSNNLISIFFKLEKETT